MKLTKAKELTIYKIYVATLIVLVIVLICTTASQAVENRNEKVLREASMELMMFAINVSSYCAESNNLTYQELMNEYIMHVARELTSDAYEKKGDGGSQ